MNAILAVTVLVAVLAAASLAVLALVAGAIHAEEHRLSLSERPGTFVRSAARAILGARASETAAGSIFPSAPPPRRPPGPSEPDERLEDAEAPGGYWPGPFSETLERRVTAPTDVPAGSSMDPYTPPYAADPGSWRQLWASVPDSTVS
jgi:hypothetical protein